MPSNSTVTYLKLFTVQCFDTVGWAAGRASGLKKMGGWWRWALVSPDGVAAGWSVSLPLLVTPCTIKSSSSLLAPAHPGGPGKRAIKRLWCGDTARKNSKEKVSANDRES